MKHIYKSLIAVSLFSANVNGATMQGGTVVDYTGNLPEAVILDAVGNPLASGYYGVGYFNLSDEAIADFILIQDAVSLNSSFVALGSDNFQTGVPSLIGTGATPGLASLNNTNFNPTPGLGRTLYTFITDGTMLGDTQSYALYKHTGVIIAADPENPPATEYSALLDGGELLFGTAGGPLLINATDVGPVNFAQTIQIAAIPEPSSLMLSVIGMSILLRRKR